MMMYTLLKYTRNKITIKSSCQHLIYFELRLLVYELLSSFFTEILPFAVQKYVLLLAVAARLVDQNSFF